MPFPSHRLPSGLIHCGLAVFDYIHYSSIVQAFDSFLTEYADILCFDVDYSSVAKENDTNFNRFRSYHRVSVGKFAG